MTRDHPWGRYRTLTTTRINEVGDWFVTFSLPAVTSRNLKKIPRVSFVLKSPASAFLPDEKCDGRVVCSPARISFRAGTLWL